MICALFALLWSHCDAVIPAEQSQGKHHVGNVHKLIDPNDTLIPLHDLVVTPRDIIRYNGRWYLKGFFYTGGNPSVWPSKPSLYVIPSGTNFDPHDAVPVKEDDVIRLTNPEFNPRCRDQGARSEFTIRLPDTVNNPPSDPPKGVVIAQLKGTALANEGGSPEWSVVASYYPFRPAEVHRYNNIIPITVYRPWEGPQPTPQTHVYVYTHTGVDFANTSYFYVKKGNNDGGAELGPHWETMSNEGQKVERSNGRKKDFHFNEHRARYVMIAERDHTSTCESSTMEWSGIEREIEP